MGRSKVYRQNLKALIKSVHTKTIHNWLVKQTKTRFGIATQEAELIAEKAEILLTNTLDTSLGNTFNIDLLLGTNNHQKIKSSCNQFISTKLTAYSHDDLNIYMKLGLKAMQNSRICRLIEEAYFQNTLFSYKQLCTLLNITAKSIRQRLIPLWELGIRLPLHSTAKKYRNFHSFRASFVLKQYFNGQSLHHLRNLFFFSDTQWELWCRQFLLIANPDNCYNLNLTSIPDELTSEYKELLNLVKDSPKFKKFKNSFQHLAYGDELNSFSSDQELFIHNLLTNHNFSKAKSNMYLQMINDLKKQLSQYKRPDNSIVYFAISDKESPGQLLSFSHLKPVILKWWIDDDFNSSNLDSTENLKWQKIIRLATEAYGQSTCLNQPDLSFLLAIHPGVIQKLIKKNNNIFLPLRGNIADMGPGITHSEKIIELYLQGYTETEILRRTGHTYASIERYLVMFSRVVALKDRNMPLPLIRQTIGCSIKLVEKYARLYEKYNIPDYQFTLMQVRRIFNQNSKIDAKKKHYQPTRRSIWDD